MYVVTFFFLDAQTFGDFIVYCDWVYTPGGSQKTNKDNFYIPMSGSPTINVMVCALFGGSPKLKAKPFTLGFLGYSNA